MTTKRSWALFLATLSCVAVIMLGGTALATTPPAVSFGTPRQTTAFGNNLMCMATGDFNGDGKVDMAVTSRGGSPINSVHILIGDGAGGFSLGQVIAVGNTPDHAVVADFDRDGSLDLAVSSYGSDCVSILRGDGSGTFSRATTLTAGSHAEGLAVGDFNGDGNPDLAVCNQNGDSVSIGLGDGSGAFSNGTTLTVGSAPYAVAVSDLNQDGKQDLAVVDSGSNDVAIRLGNGSGGFSIGTTVAVGSSPDAIAVGDLDGNGTPDLAVANYGTQNVSIRLGSGSGTFSNAANVGTASGPESVALGDLNGDGNLDIVTADWLFTISVRSGDGKGAFPTGSAVDLTTGSYPGFISVALADLDRDGRLDIAAASYSSGTPSGSWVGTYLNTSSIAQRVAYLPAKDCTIGPDTNPLAAAAGDFNRDAKPDLVVANDADNSMSVLLGDGSGGFSFGTTSTIEYGPTALATGDFNRDGNLDVASLDYTGNVAIRLGAGDGTFTDGGSLPIKAISYFEPGGICAADLDRNGTLDLVAAAGDDDKISVLKGDGAGGFTYAATLTVGPGSGSPGWARPISVAAGDINGDGKPDLVVGDSQSSKVSVLLGDGACGFTFGTTVTASSGNTGEVALADMNRDGHLDMVFKSGSAVHVKLGDGHGQFPTTKEISLPATALNSLEVADFDRDGIPDVVVTIQNPSSGSAAVLDNDGTGQLSLDRTVPLLIQAVDVAPADFNSDGELDLAIVCAKNPGIVSILLGRTTPPVTTLHLDPASPGGPNNWYTSAPQVGLSVDEPANKYYQWDWWTPGGYQSYSTTLTAPEGSHTFYYYSVDAADNTETARGEVIKVDSTPPSGTFAIDGGAAYTTTSSIASADSTVTDVGGSGVTTMTFSGDIPGGGGPWPYAAHWGIRLTAGDGTKTVDAEYTDLVGHTFDTSDTIVLDTQAPSGTMALNGGAATVTNSLAVTVDSSVSDTTSGMSTMRWSTDGGSTWGGWTGYVASLGIVLPVPGSLPYSPTVTVQYKDRAGNSLERSDSINVVDNQPPTGTMAINGGAASTHSLAVTIDSSMSDAVSGVRQMCWNVGPGWSAWVAYSPSVAINLPTTAAPYDRLRTVWVQYADLAGNRTALISDSIQFTRPKASLTKPTVSPSTPRPGRYCTFTGYVSPYVGGSSKLYLYRKVGKRWVKYKIVSVANKLYGARARWTYKVKLPYSGVWYARPYYAGGPTVAANWGVQKNFTVR